MSGIVGLLYICKRCGNQEFSKSTGELNPYTAPIPEGWTCLEKDHICPQCAVPLKRFMSWFFNEKDCPKKWKENKDVSV